MSRTFLAPAVLTILSACATPETMSGEEVLPAAGTAPIEVMIVGTWHFETQDSNLIDVAGPDVLTPERQREMGAVVGGLMAFDPTVVAVEVQTNNPDFVDTGYEGYSPARLTQTPNEVVQLGYRLADRAGLGTVYGIDEQPRGDEPAYFPFDKVMAHAASTGDDERLQSTIMALQAKLVEQQAAFDGMTMAEAIIETNEGFTSSADFYYDMLRIDAGEDQPAAELIGYYTMRNAKIFSKLLDVAGPGDRVVVIYGAGHKHWLEQLAENTPGVRLVQPTPFLEAVR